VPSTNWSGQRAGNKLPDGGAAGQVLTKVSNNAYDVDWAPPASGPGANRAYSEVPVGAGQNFVLASAPNPPESLQLFWNGVLQHQGVGLDYTLAGNEITMAEMVGEGDPFVAFYNY